MGASTENFFEDTMEQSVVKATIVEKYFDAWAGIITNFQNRADPNQTIGYVDLFAGPGRYKVGTTSTPIKIIEKAIEKYPQRLVSIFNDKSPENVSQLKYELERLPGYGTLKHKPTIWNEEVGDKIAQQFASINTIPILAFIDPWGYKGLTLNLVNAFLKNWGCDCIFFFNYGRINAGLSNPYVTSHMNALFGEERADAMRAQLEPMNPQQREATIVNGLAEALKAYGHRFVLPFCFKNEKGTRTKHHLILVTKHFKGYDVMKGIMAKESSMHEQGVPSFTYCPAQNSSQSLLFELNRPLDELRSMLLRDFVGRTATMLQIYEEHSIDRRFISKNYKDVLAALEKEKVIQTSGRRSNRGFANEITVTFPRKVA